MKSIRNVAPINAALAVTFRSNGTEILVNFQGNQHTRLNLGSTKFLSWSKSVFFFRYYDSDDILTCNVEQISIREPFYAESSPFFCYSPNVISIRCIDLKIRKFQRKTLIYLKFLVTTGKTLAIAGPSTLKFVVVLGHFDAVFRWAAGLSFKNSGDLKN